MYSRGLDAYPGQVRLRPLLVDLPIRILAHNPQKTNGTTGSFSTEPLPWYLWYESSCGAAASRRKLVIQPGMPSTDQDLRPLRA